MSAVERQEARVDGDEFQQNHRWPLDLREDFFHVGRALIEEKMFRGQLVPQSRAVEPKDVIDGNLIGLRSLLVDDRYDGVKENVVQFLERIVEEKRVVEKDEEQLQRERSILTEVRRPCVAGLLIPFGDFACFQTIDNEGDDVVRLLLIGEQFTQNEADRRAELLTIDLVTVGIRLKIAEDRRQHAIEQIIEIHFTFQQRGQIMAKIIVRFVGGEISRVAAYGLKADVEHTTSLVRALEIFVFDARIMRVEAETRSILLQREILFDDGLQTFEALLR